MIYSVLSEYGVKWLTFRTLYSSKLRMMQKIPATEKILERHVKIKRINLIDINTTKIKAFLNSLPLEKKQEIILIADNAIEGKLKAFMSTELDYGNPINWHFNPITQTVVNKY